MSDDEYLSEERRLEIIEQIRQQARDAGYPDFDVESVLGGHLAGPASADRPDVPVWQYAEYAAASETTLEELLQIRFPLWFYGGSTITSVAEELRPPRVVPEVMATADEIIHRYEMMHAAGVLEWDSDARAVRQVKSMSEYRRVFSLWWSQLRR